MVTGAAEGAWVSVRGEIRTGDRVVTRGNERLRSGQAVVATPLNDGADAGTQR